MSWKKNPKISIVTISYNSGAEIEDTIKSVIDQTYSNKEYLIIDGGSKDNTMGIVNRYRDKIDYIVSEPDKGRSDAFNKGIKAATGNYIVMMNAGDMLTPNTLKSTRHFDEIDICKGIAILLVLLFHSFILYPIRLKDIPWCHYIMDVIGSFFMPVFFLVSGFLFVNSKNKQYLHILSSKVKRLLIPLISYEAVTLGVKLVVPSLINRKVLGIDSYITNLVLGG